MRTTHLRIFTLHPAADAGLFAKRFRDEVGPVYAKFGLTLEGGWISTSTPDDLNVGAGRDGSIPWIIGKQNLFVYLVSHDGPDRWGDRMREFYDSADYAAISGDLQSQIAERQFLFVSRTLP